MNTNQIGRELTRKLIETHGCDIQSAIRFYYNSRLYPQIKLGKQDIDKLYTILEQEYYNCE